MASVQAGPLLGLVAQLALLLGLDATTGLGVRGWVTGLTCALVLDAALARGITRTPTQRLGPADRVTLVRATLACGCAALAADAVDRLPSGSALTVLAAVALVLDAVDGRVARRTGTASDLGAKFDMEVDAFLLLVLSVAVAPVAGAWVLASGGARYAFLGAGRLAPWIRTAALPPRYWRKVVAATQGIVLVLATTRLLPPALVTVALVAALALLAESFGRDVWWLWRRRRALSGAVVLPEPRRCGDHRSVVLEADRA